MDLIGQMLIAYMLPVTIVSDVPVVYTHNIHKLTLATFYTYTRVCIIFTFLRSSQVTRGPVDLHFMVADNNYSVWWSPTHVTIGTA